MSDREVVVLSGVRTGIGKFGGGLKDVPPSDLGATVIREAVQRAEIDPEQVEHCVVGQIIHTEPGDMYLSRVAALKGGLPDKVPCLTLNRLCGTGLQAIVTASQYILLGDIDCAVAGGAESMSRGVFMDMDHRWGHRMGASTLQDATVGGLTDPMLDYHMGVTAENVAERWNVTREDQDELAVESHRRAARAHEEGRFDEQIVTVEVESKKGTKEFREDEHVRPDADMEVMGKLPPAFKEDGTVTAGNAAGMNDAASAVVLMERSEAEAQGKQWMGRLVAYAHSAVEPKYMGIGPVPAVRRVLEKADLKVDDLDVIELNEAFAAQTIAVIRDLGLPKEKTNPNGSGISLGHPVGATGCMLTVKALYELQRVDGQYALVTMCIGGGQGIAAIFERNGNQ